MKYLFVFFSLISISAIGQYKEFSPGYYYKGDTVKVTVKNSLYVAVRSFNASTIPSDNTYWDYAGVIPSAITLEKLDARLKIIEEKLNTTAPPPPTTSERKNIIFQDLAGEASWPVRGTSTSYGITKSNIAGKDAIRFEVRKGDPVFAGGVRAELSRYIETTASYPYEVWYGMSYYIPSDWVFDQPTLFDILNQWHDEGGSLKSPFDFSINGSKWRYQVRSNDISGVEKGVDFSTVERGVWTDFVFHLKFVKSGTGIVEIWKNGTKVVTDNTPMGWSTATNPPFFKMGIYKWPWNPQDLACCGATNSTSHTIGVSNFRLGNSAATYNDVKP